MCLPEDIPEDREQSYPCPDCGGNITLGEGLAGWECDGCNFYRSAPENLGVAKNIVQQPQSKI